MRIEDIDISLILPQPGMSNASHNEEEEEKGFFAKLFKKKETPDKPFYESRIEELGYDEIYSELSDDPDKELSCTSGAGYYFTRAYYEICDM